MTLKKATLYTIIGLVYIFVSRMVATIYPGIFQNIIYVRVNTLISFLAVLTPVLFLYYFSRDYVTQRQKRLKTGAKFALWGSILVALLFLKSVFQVFTIMNVDTPLLNLIISFINVLFLLYFFLVFCQEVSTPNHVKFRLSIIFVIIGLIFLLIMRLMILFNYLYASKFTWLWDFARALPFLVLPLIAFSFIARLNFFIFFYRRQ